MSSVSLKIVPPVRLVPDAGTGRLTGSNSRYEKHLSELAGVYRDEAAFAALLGQDDGTPVYWVEASNLEPGPGGLIVGLSVLLPGRVGDEFAMTRGHLHAIADRSELYSCVAGHGVMLMDTTDGRSEAVELCAGESVYVPGNWVHRSVNVGDVPFITQFVYSEDAGQDYGLIHEAGGMSSLVVDDGNGGWTTRVNLEHVGYSRTGADS